MAQLIEPFEEAGAGDLAQALVATFGSVRRAIFASEDQITSATAGNAQLARQITAARVMMETVMREEILRMPIHPADPALLEYLRLKIGALDEERLHAIFLDNQCRYIRDETVSDGHAGEIRFHRKRLFQRAFELGAQAIILAHNHPSGSADPSESDIAETRILAGIATQLGLRLVDHLIVARNGVSSLKAGGHL
jgi:DNA repair protein RadC